MNKYEKMELCEKFVQSLIENEPHEVKGMIIHIALVLAMKGVEIGTPESTRALEKIVSYSAFMEGINK